MRVFAAVLAGLIGLVAVHAQQTGQERVVGNWKVSFLDEKELITFWLLKLEIKDGKAAGTLDVVPKGPTGELKNLLVKGDKLLFTIDLAGQPLQFAFKLPQGDAKRLVGSMTLQGGALPAQMESTKEDSAKDFTAFSDVPLIKGDLKRIRDEITKRSDITIFAAAGDVFNAATEAKASAAELHVALTPLLEAAKQYGEWQNEFLIQCARRATNHEQFAVLGETMSRQALAQFGDSASAATKLRCLDLLALSLGKQNKKGDLEKVQAQIDVLEVKGHEENEKEGLGFVPAKFAGRKGNRTVLVELFTGAQCPPCVAADLAFEGLAKTYAPSEVVLLQYHLHIPGPDPMTTADTEERSKYYGDQVRGTPTIFFNGKSAAGGGGFRQHAPGKYKEYRELVEPLLEETGKITMKADCRRTGDAISIKTVTAGYESDKKLKLRMALVEPWVRFAGSNGLSYHAHVVRAMPGGPNGFALDKELAKNDVKIDLAALRMEADKHLRNFPSLDGLRPFSYRNLHLVAFVQDDDTKQVLHAIEVPVK